MVLLLYPVELAFGQLFFKTARSSLSVYLSKSPFLIWCLSYHLLTHPMLLLYPLELAFSQLFFETPLGFFSCYRIDTLAISLTLLSWSASVVFCKAGLGPALCLLYGRPRLCISWIISLRLLSCHYDSWACERHGTRHGPRHFVLDIWVPWHQKHLCHTRIRSDKGTLMSCSMSLRVASPATHSTLS